MCIFLAGKNLQDWMKNNNSWLFIMQWVDITWILILCCMFVQCFAINFLNQCLFHLTWFLFDLYKLELLQATTHQDVYQPIVKLDSCFRVMNFKLSYWQECVYSLWNEILVTTKEQQPNNSLHPGSKLSSAASCLPKIQLWFYYLH